jgi:hypothetical protein
VAANRMIERFISMWPREICDLREVGQRSLFIKGFPELNEPGVYVLYRDEHPYYIGKAQKLFNRIHDHANKSTDRYYNFWNFFSAFVVTNEKHSAEVEKILIAAMPTANSSMPRMSKVNLPKDIVARMRRIRRHQTDPVTRQDFAELLKRMRELEKRLPG